VRDWAVAKGGCKGCQPKWRVHGRGGMVAVLQRTNVARALELGMNL